MSQVFNRHLLIALTVSVLVFGATGWVSYSVAAHLHHTGTDLLTSLN